MDTENGKSTRPSRRRNKPRVKFFYLDGQLHKVLSVIRGMDLVKCWHYADGKRVGYVWSDVRKRMGPAFTTFQVAEMIGRHHVNIRKYLVSGSIRRPQRAYSLDGRKLPGKHYWSEKDVYELHDFLLTVHRGRPRKDGQITPGNMPSKAELRAMMRHDTVMYVKQEDGTFVPVWKEVDW